MTDTTSTTTTEAAKPPVAKLRLGLLNASIWQNVTEKGTFYNVTFERQYKESEGKWQSAYSYDFDDLLLLAKLDDQAHTRITVLQSGDAE